uniref:Pentatricopeptide repeat-containing protein At5g56310 n=1 Tax=Elaeis guineensis var. tenera TaxID=51953 RepID=A0A6I9Q8J4_ELAGV|nr:pentatricopeptide repeat-containing protein At5g56310 [Elaeis guineensis]XP_010904822.1 pentatricopeptide repeat-containing protein At5g56310 [Elaeis guineensis]
MSIPPLRTTSKTLSPTAQRILHSLNTCTSPSQLLQIQAQILLHNLHPNTTIASSFIDTCLSLGHLSPAFALFSSLRRPHVFVCNTLIRAALLLPSSSSPPPPPIYSHMLQSSVPPNNYTFPLLLKSLPDLQQGRMIHSHVLKTGLSADIYVQNSLLKLYSSCIDMTTCEQLFDEMPVKEVISWTTMIMGYKNCGRPDEALIAFERMQFAGVWPNRVTMVNALTACASHGALEMGVWIHDYIKRSGWELDVILGTSLVDMYGKCGRVDAGVNVFSSMMERNVYTWNSLIRGLALAKSGEEALRWFFRMEHEGVKPDAVTLIGVLCACSHAGLVEMGQRIFSWMVSGRYGFYPGVKHYGCMVDLLGRAGFLNAAVEFIERMPFKPNMVIWGSLLRGCRAHGDLRLSELAVKKLVELEPANVAHYVLLSNLYAESGRWRDAGEVRRLMKEWGLRKDAGWSFTEGMDLKECVG